MKTSIVHSLGMPLLLAATLTSTLCADPETPPATRENTGTGTSIPHTAEASQGHSTQGAPTITPEQALKQLVDGNLRFTTGKSMHPNQSGERRQELAKGQSPFAIVLTCSDSRVAPELYLDQGLGDLFVIRNAGNILDDHVIGSIEYAVEHLHVGLIVVIGHAKCGAVAATVAGGEAPGHIRSIVESIEPAAEEAKSLPGDKVDNTVRANARRVASILNQVDPFLKPLAAERKLKVVAAHYDLATGKLEIEK